MDNDLTIHAAARRLGISVRTARRWIKAGMLPAELRESRHGPAYAIPLAGVAAIIAQRGTGRVEGEQSTGRDDLHRALAGLLEMAADIRADAQLMREELAALRALLPISQGGEQREDELAGPRQRRDERQAEEQRAREAE